MADAGNVVITAFISPYRADRQRARAIAMEGNAEFVEVFVDAPLAGLRRTGSEKSLQKGEGRGDPRVYRYRRAVWTPVDPEIVVQTHQQSVEESTATILERLLPRLK